MPLQRVCDAEKQARNTGSNGPRRVQGNGESGVFCNALGCVSSRGYVGILQSGIVRGLYIASPAMKQGGTADNRFIRPWQRTFSLLRIFCVSGLVAERRDFLHPSLLESRRKRQGRWQRNTQAHPVKRWEKSHPTTGRE